MSKAALAVILILCGYLLFYDHPEWNNAVRTMIETGIGNLTALIQSRI